MWTNYVQIFHWIGLLEFSLKRTYFIYFLKFFLYFCNSSFFKKCTSWLVFPEMQEFHVFKQTFLYSSEKFSNFFWIFFLLHLKIGRELLCTIVLVSAICHINQPQVYICPLPPEYPSHLPLHPTPLGCHRAPSLSSLHHAANFHWLPHLHMVIYMSQCYSFSLWVSLLPLLCPQICSLCLHLHCCPANRFISTAFLDSIYIH